MASANGSFIVLGDWGLLPIHNTFRLKSKVRDHMAEWADTYHPEFVLSTGDNFYPAGITSVDDPKIDKDWRTFYAAGWLKDIPWYISLGNHDHDGDVSAQLQLAKKEPRWILPNNWYDFDRVFEDNVRVHFVVLDTMLLVDDWHMWRHYGADDVSSGKQIKFLKDSLSSSSADWNIVVGHHPIFTIGLHGWLTESNDVMKSVVNPILKECGADVYLCGHDHNLQYIIDHQSPNLHYILSGSGGGETYKKHQRYEKQLRDKGIESLTFIAKPGYVTAQVTKHTLSFDFQVDGNVSFNNVITKNQHDSNTPEAQSGKKPKRR